MEIAHRKKCHLNPYPTLGQGSYNEAGVCLKAGFFGSREARSKLFRSFFFSTTFEAVGCVIVRWAMSCTLLLPPQHHRHHCIATTEPHFVDYDLISVYNTQHCKKTFLEHKKCREASKPFWFWHHVLQYTWWMGAMCVHYALCFARCDVQSPPCTLGCVHCKVWGIHYALWRCAIVHVAKCNVRVLRVVGRRQRLSSARLPPLPNWRWRTGGTRIGP